MRSNCGSKQVTFFDLLFNIAMVEYFFSEGVGIWNQVCYENIGYFGCLKQIKETKGSLLKLKERECFK